MLTITFNDSDTKSNYIALMGLYPRPEGISFQRNRNLIISNENKKTEVQ